jgi:hypothetical protein
VQYRSGAVPVSVQHIVVQEVEYSAVFQITSAVEPSTAKSSTVQYKYNTASTVPARTAVCVAGAVTSRFEPGVDSRHEHRAKDQIALYQNRESVRDMFNRVLAWRGFELCCVCTASVLLHRPPWDGMLCYAVAVVECSRDLEELYVIAINVAECCV